MATLARQDQITAPIADESLIGPDATSTFSPGSASTEIADRASSENLYAAGRKTALDEDEEVEDDDEEVDEDDDLDDLDEDDDLEDDEEDEDEEDVDDELEDDDDEDDEDEDDEEEEEDV